MQPTPREALLADLRAEILQCDDFLRLSDPMDLDHRFVVGVKGGLRVLRESPDTLTSLRVFGPRRVLAYHDAVKVRATLNGGTPWFGTRVEVYSQREAIEALRESLSAAVATLEKLVAA